MEIVCSLLASNRVDVEIRRRGRHADLSPNFVSRCLQMSLIVEEESGRKKLSVEPRLCIHPSALAVDSFVHRRESLKKVGHGKMTIESIQNNEDVDARLGSFRLVSRSSFFLSSVVNARLLHRLLLLDDLYRFLKP